MAQYRATSDTLGITWGKARTVLEAVCRSAALQAEEVGAASRLTTLGSTPADCAFIIGTLIFLCLAAFLDSAFRSENVAAAIVALIGASVSAYFLKTTRAAESSELSTRLSVIADKFNEACSNDDADTSGLQFSQMHALRHGSPLTSVVPVYRNGQWHRVPTLLLVESDLIALATSDVAPGAAIEYLAQSDSSATPRPIVLAKGDLVPEKDYARSRTLGEIDTFLDLCGQVRCFRMQETPAKEYLKRITSSLAEERDLHQSPLAEVHLRKLASLLYRCKLVIAVVVFFVCVLRFIIERRPNEWVYYLIIRPAAAMTVVLFPSLPVLVTFIEMIASAQLIECSERSRIATTSKPKEVNLFEAIFGWILQSGLCSLKRVISQRLGKSTFSQLALRSWLVGDAWNPEQSPVPLRSSKLVERLGIVTMLSVVDEEVIFEPFSVPETVFFKGASSSKSLKFYQSGSGFGFEDPSWWQCMTSLKPIGLCAMVVATKMGNIEVEDEEVNVLNRESQTRMREALVKHIRRSPPAEHGSLSGSDFSRDDQHHVDLALEIGFSNEDLSLFVEKRRVHVLNRSNRRGLAADPDSPDDTYSQEDSWRRGYVHPVRICELCLLIKKIIDSYILIVYYRP
jgi:multisubunit Na+/H+ antiporter MnhG subunit